MKNKKLSLIFGILLIIVGIVFILSPTDVFQSIVMFIGIALIVMSIIGIIASLGKEGLSSYYLTSYIFELVIGIVLVSNTDIAIKVIPVFLGIWLFISGLVTTISLSRVSNSLAYMTSPIAKMVLGLICFVTPAVPISIFGIFVGIVLILSGFSIITSSKDDATVYKVKVKNVKKK